MITRVRHAAIPRALITLWVAVSLSACDMAPSPSGSASAPTRAPSAAPGPSGSGSAGPPASDAPAPTLAGALRDAVDGADILADLARLQEITGGSGGGARPAGSDAEGAAITFVADALREAGLVVELQAVDVAYFTQTGPSVLEVAGGGALAFEDIRDFKAMLFSASGDVTAPVHPLGFDPLAQGGASTGLGCSAADWADVPAGVIVLVQPAPCRRHDVVVQAQEAGAVAIITAYPGWARDAVLRPTLINPDDIRIPALGVTHAAGVAIAEAAAAGRQVHISVQASIETRSSVNVIGETVGGDPAHVVMLGGHLDSALDSPGINDNGTGTMTILEIARVVASAMDAQEAGAAPWKLRVALWTAEELGLWGSSAYVRELDGAASDAIEAYINLDMIGSPNGVRLLYDGAGTSRPTESSALAGLFARAFESSDLVWQSAAIGGSSDHFAFDQAGIPVGGLYSGSTEPKTAAQAALFGGTADDPNDPCHHIACDTVDNVDPVLLVEMARAAAWVTGALVSGEVTLGAP